MPPLSPKKKRGLLSEIMAIIRVKTSIPCATGFRVEPSLVYMFEIGTSVILRPSSVALAIISVSTANPFSVRQISDIALLESALKPDSESVSFSPERRRVECRSIF